MLLLSWSGASLTLVDGIVVDLEVFHPQLAAGDDRRAPDLDPAAVVVGLVEQPGRLLGLDRLVVGHVEELDDLPFDVDHLGNPDGRAEAAGDPLGDAGLAVARDSRRGTSRGPS